MYSGTNFPCENKKYGQLDEISSDVGINVDSCYFALRVQEVRTVYNVQCIFVFCSGFTRNTMLSRPPCILW